MNDWSNDADSTSDPKPARSGAVAIFAAATVLALVISGPAIAVSVVMYYILKTNLILTSIASLLTLFIAMGFGYKLSGRLARIQRAYNKRDDNKNK